MNKLQNYFEIDKCVLTTTEVIKTSFKSAFEKLDKNDFVIMENKRRKDKMVLINLNVYASMLKEIEDMKELIFDSQISKVIEEDDSKLVEI